MQEQDDFSPLLTHIAPSSTWNIASLVSLCSVIELCGASSKVLQLNSGE